MTDSFLEQTIGQTLGAFTQLAVEQRNPAIRAAIPDLQFFIDQGLPLERRNAPARTLELARSLYEALRALPEEGGASRTLLHRIVTDEFLRGEADRDQNVYLGKLFTRHLTRAVPDLIFQPVHAHEAQRALRWARERGVPVTLRGAASTAMGGSVPNDAGLTLDLSRLDLVDVDARARVCVVGAGARLRIVHQRLAEHGLALEVYPSNLGGTLAGWFVTGGIGLNAFVHGRALDSVRAADVLLPAGEHVRFHDDGRLDVLDDGARRTLAAVETAAWFSERGYQAMTLADLAGSEGVFGLLLQLTVSVEPRPGIGAFLLGFRVERDALDAAAWIGEFSGQIFGAPANLKLLSGSHMEHTRRVWKDEDARAWRRKPGALSSEAGLPWTRIAGPGELGAAIAPDDVHAAAYLFVDFIELAPARTFAAALPGCPGAPAVMGDESVRFAAERFRPQQTKRLGPGLLAAEILMPAAEVKAFLPRAARLARNAGSRLDAEVYFLADGSALVIAGYLTDHRSGAFALDLVLAPALLDLAMSDHRARPYVLGRWQSAWMARKFGAGEAARLTGIKRGLDPGMFVNRGVLLGLRLHGGLGALLAAGFAPGVSLMKWLYDTRPLYWLVRGLRAVLAPAPGPARGRGEAAVVGAEFRVAPPGLEPAAEPHGNGAEGPATPQQASARALHCVNCGECNSVCPIFHESKIRLPQMLTHIGEAMHAGERIGETGSVLLDLCMRCGNCEEVCQAGIPHLPLYERMQQASDRVRPPDRERHVALVAALRGSPRYTREFLQVRPGGYQKRTQASLPGVARYLLLRAENDAGPAATCIHCGACVAVCPTLANREFEGADPRWVTTEQHKCIGCGTCVEVCPANHLNGGQTLRVMEAPTLDWFLALEAFERQEQP